MSGGGDRAEAVLGLPCGRSGQIGAQVRCHVVHDPLEAEPLKGATKPIGELAIGVKIERLAGNRGALRDLALNREHGAAARDLFLAFAQPVDAAKVRRDARQHVTEATRHLEPRVAVNEQLSAIGHLAAPFRGAGDHLTGQLPAPNCSHDKSALSGYPWRHRQAYATASQAATNRQIYRTFQRRSPFSQLPNRNQTICRQVATRPQKKRLRGQRQCALRCGRRFGKSGLLAKSRQSPGSSRPALPTHSWLEECLTGLGRVEMMRFEPHAAPIGGAREGGRPPSDEVGGVWDVGIERARSRRATSSPA